MHINPILNIEMKRHARTLKCCGVFFGLNLLLGIIFLVSYLSIVGRDNYLTAEHYRYMVQCYVIMGYSLFMVLCLLLPGIAGSAITKEREKNTFDILLSTQLSPMRIVVGKLLVSLWLIVLIIISVMPMISVIMALGEVSMFDLIKLTLSLVLVGIFVGSISIFFSAIFKASNRAVLFSYVVVFGITVGTLVFTRMISFLAEIRIGQSGEPEMIELGNWIYLLLINPIVMFFGSLSSQVGNGNELLEICNTMGNYSDNFIVKNMSAFAIVLQMAVSFLLLRLAARMLSSAKR